MDARVVDQVGGSPVFATMIVLNCIAVLFLYLRHNNTEGSTVTCAPRQGIPPVLVLLSAIKLTPGVFFIPDVLELDVVVSKGLAGICGMHSASGRHPYRGRARPSLACTWNSFEGAY